MDRYRAGAAQVLGAEEPPREAAVVEAERAVERAVEVEPRHDEPRLKDAVDEAVAAANDDRLAVFLHRDVLRDERLAAADVERRLPVAAERRIQRPRRKHP